MPPLSRIFRSLRFWSLALGVPALLLAVAGLRLLSDESDARRAFEERERRERTAFLGAAVRNVRAVDGAASSASPVEEASASLIEEASATPVGADVAAAPAPLVATAAAADVGSLCVGWDFRMAAAEVPDTADGWEDLAEDEVDGFAEVGEKRKGLGHVTGDVTADIDEDVVGGIAFDTDGMVDPYDRSMAYGGGGPARFALAPEEERDVSAVDAPKRRNRGVRRALESAPEPAAAGLEPPFLGRFRSESGGCGDGGIALFGGYGERGLPLLENEDASFAEFELPDAKASGAAAGALLSSVMAGTSSGAGGGMRLVACEIRDAGGRIVWSEGGPVPDGTGDVVPLDPDLPGWTLRAVWSERDGGGASAAGAQRLRLVGGILLLLFAAAPLAASALLWRQARRERREARRKTDFVATVSHELRTPLTSIRLHAELLAAGKVPEGELRRQSFETILSECDRLGRLVGNVLDFGRLERGSRRYASETLDLSALAREVCEASRADLEARGGGVRVSDGGAGDAPVTACADRDAVRQILLNLLDNAVKYAASGGPAEVTVRRLDDGRAELRVEDRGPGVASGDRERVFERFFRADDSVTRETRGSGLGLSIARGLARGMCGGLECRPRRGGGSAFVLTLPGGDEGATEARDGARTPTGGRKDGGHPDCGR